MLPAETTEPKAVACLTRFAGRSPGEITRHGNSQVAGDEHWMREGPCVGMFQRIRGKPARTRPLHLQEAASGTITKIAGTRLAMVAALVDTALLARFDEGNGFLRFHHFRRDEDRSCHETSAVLHAFILELDIDPVALLRNVEDLV